MSAVRPRPTARSGPTTTARVRAAGLALLAGAALAVAGLTLPGVAGSAHADAVTVGGTAAADDGARVVAESRVDARTVDLTVRSPALGTTAMVRLLLPAGWNAQPAKTWPALYLLEGANEPVDYKSWTTFSDVEAFTADKPVLVVMPSDGSDGLYSDWHDLGFFGGPKWETFHTTELPQLLARDYRASGVNAVAGLSLGGLGAMNYAAQHPGLFKAAASYSGLLNTQGLGDPLLVQTILLRGGHSPVQAWGSPTVTPGLWAQHNPTLNAPKLKGVKLFLSSGTGQIGGPYPADNAVDTALGAGIETVIWNSQAGFVAALKANDIPVTTDFYGPGLHSWPYWQREFHTSWPVLAAGLGIPA
jgi:S-formylglutathione hydrolase FrmB